MLVGSNWHIAYHEAQIPTHSIPPIGKANKNRSDSPTAHPRHRIIRQQHHRHHRHLAGSIAPTEFRNLNSVPRQHRRETNTGSEIEDEQDGFCEAGLHALGILFGESDDDVVACYAEDELWEEGVSQRVGYDDEIDLEVDSCPEREEGVNDLEEQTPIPRPSIWLPSAPFPG